MQHEKKDGYSLYQKRKAIFPKSVKGKAKNRRRLTGALIYGALFLLPWLNWGDHPAVFFNLDKRQLHFFDWLFMPQDVFYLACFFIIAAFALFLFTTVAGRLWCGFACPQTIWTALFVFVEEKLQGSSLQRKKQAQKTFTLPKIATHLVWLLIAFITAFSFVGFFYPIRELVVDLATLNFSLVAAFWLALFTWLTYVDAGLLREQVCIHMCPYAKFQSVMYDEDTLIVAYNVDNGEPRGSLKSNKGGGCIDCSLCVQVCPTGIDIRDGLQIDCINCGLCIDACDHVMTTIGRENNLISFNTLNKLNGKASSILRPKTVAYSLILVIMVGLLGYNLSNRGDIESSLVRERDRMHRFNSKGEVSNTYRFKITNKSDRDIDAQLVLKTEGFRLLKNKPLTLSAGESLEQEIIVMSMPKSVGSYDLAFEVMSDDLSLDQLDARYLYPTLRK